MNGDWERSPLPIDTAPHIAKRSSFGNGLTQAHLIKQNAYCSKDSKIQSLKLSTFDATRKFYGKTRHRD
ncbi:hypothetical protein BBW65_03630 [Helicobacter enhydrae]|uniref:Uncharacterized protein n=1 Tax=Helicobacter enhydrae TaxID=222136 RepID=A0A1B1U596_9HELI|nr:hypothetical protein [Helicobacter enhydrae]ANV97943.1 hypothetical protein BBW65_03630 [Helicobacter enhydrae]